MNTKQILFLSANPRGYEKLKLIEECKGIARKIQSATYGNQFKVEQEHNVSVQDLQELLTERYSPQVIHFAGHGKRGSLLLQDEKGNVEEAKLNPFTEILRILEKRPNVSEFDKVRLVVLSACYSERIANAVAGFVECVIGMSNPINDDSARIFGETLYSHLCSGRSVKEAFEFARNQVELLGERGQSIPKLKAKRGVEVSKTFLIPTESLSTLDIFNILKKCFTTQFDIKVLCAGMRSKGLDELRPELAEINAPDVPKMLLNLIEYCEARGKISSLISCTIDERPGVKKLLDLKERCGGS